MKVIIVVLAIKISLATAIIAGDSINIEDAPYMVFVQEVINLSRGFVEKCGGAIIRDRIDATGARVAKFVVTAARCVVDAPSLTPKSPKDFYLLFASTERGGIDTSGEFIDGIARVHIHPGYRGYGSPHDIAILEMKDEIALDGVKKRAIKLASEHEGDVVAQGTECLVAAWGLNPSNSESKQLFQATMHVESYQLCAQQYGKYTTVELLMKHQICALGASSNYSNICHGDYGSPLVRASDEILLGIASFGRRCDNSTSANFLSIFTKISDNLDFINYVTKSYQ